MLHHGGGALAFIEQRESELADGWLVLSVRREEYC